MQPTICCSARRGFILSTAALAWPALARRDDAGAPFELARVAPPGIDPAGFLVSEKYDGVRALWDGDGRVLRFRSGRTVAAPAWFTARLPREPLDGELWLGRGRFDAVAATVRRSEPVDAEWRALRYMLFDRPGAPLPFAARAERLRRIAADAGWPQLVAVAQQTLAGHDALRRRLDAVVAGGGEGLVLHRADAAWSPGRSDALLKVKPVQDAEAVVVGHVPGQGRLAGRLGALRLRDGGGAEFVVGSGYSDADRAAPPPIGSTVTYAYRGVTPGGVPRFASYLRMHQAF